jgi:D-3-phosphoglycerate dehydrogenase
MTDHRPTILVAESRDFASDAAALLQRVGCVKLRDLSREELLREISDVDVLWVRLRHRIDREILEAAPRLRYIVSPTTGLNHIEIDEAGTRGVRVLSLRDENIKLRDVRATAELTVGLMLALLRHLPESVSHVREGGWDRDRFKGHEIYGKTVGVVGYGRLGRLVAGYMEAMGARVLACDPNVEADRVDGSVELRSFEDLLQLSDIVSLHVSYSPSTHELLGGPEFALMKEGSWLVNSSRGEVIDEQALIAALDSGQLAGAALDVLAHEQTGDFHERPLIRYAREHPNLLITPHIGGCTFESMEKTERLMAERLVKVLRPDG